MIGPSPAIVLYSKPGCGLCEEARVLLGALLAERITSGRSVPPVEERDITTDPLWEREYCLDIPVVEVGEHRLRLASSAAKLRRFLGDTLDGVTG